MAGAVTLSLSGELLIPHEAEIKPLTAVRNTLIQSSLATLRSQGHYERYSKNIDPEILQELSSNLAPSWVDIQLAHAHYRACDAMNLTAEELGDQAQSVGQRVGETSIVVGGAKRPENEVDLWTVLGQLHRAWKRVFQGGSVQVTKLSANGELIELRDFSLNRHRHFRQGFLTSLAAAHEAAGIRMESTRIVRYDAPSQDIMFHLEWS